MPIFEIIPLASAHLSSPVLPTFRLIFAFQAIHLQRFLARGAWPVLPLIEGSVSLLLGHLEDKSTFAPPFSAWSNARMELPSRIGLAIPALGIVLPLGQVMSIGVVA